MGSRRGDLKGSALGGFHRALRAAGGAGGYHGGVMLDGDLTRQARRLALSAELTRRVARCAGERIPAAATAAELVALAGRLAGIAAPVERAHRLHFEPAYPGVTGGVEALRGARRLVLACTALDAAGDPEAVVFTTLIAGRAPQVAAAPVGAPIPPGWAALAPG
jgi:hypothetical protein